MEKNAEKEEEAHQERMKAVQKAEEAHEDPEEKMIARREVLYGRKR